MGLVPAFVYVPWEGFVAESSENLTRLSMFAKKYGPIYSEARTSDSDEWSPGGGGGSGNVIAYGTFQRVHDFSVSRVMKVDNENLLSGPHAILELGLSRILRHPNYTALMSCQAVVDSRGEIMTRKLYARRRPLPCTLPALRDSVHLRKTVLYQIVRALKYMHAQNVIHADVKTANVLTYEVSRNQFPSHGAEVKSAGMTDVVVRRTV